MLKFYYYNYFAFVKLCDIIKIIKISNYKRGKMERKKFNRGTITGGTIRIVIAVVAMIIASIVLSSALKSWDPENVGGGIFMCIIATVMIVAGIYFVVNGIKMIMDGKKSFEVLKKGHAESGKILDLTETEVTETNNGCVSHYSIYNLKFEYTDDNGQLCESQEQVSQKVFTDLKEKTLVPILVYKERAIFDKKRYDLETTNK